MVISQSSGSKSFSVAWPCSLPDQSSSLTIGLKKSEKTTTERNLLPDDLPLHINLSVNS